MRQVPIIGMMLDLGTARHLSTTAEMHEFLFQYHRPHATTWAYFSSLLAIALFFKFSRLWSVRNLDLIGLISLAPGLLMVEFGSSQMTSGDLSAASYAQAGYIWLFAVSGMFLVRLLTDPMMVRRPLLEPNLSVGGQTFLAFSLLVFLLANVVTSRMSENDLRGPELAEQLRERQETSAAQSSLETHGPGYSFIFMLPSISTQSILSDETSEDTEAASLQNASRKAARMATARTVVIISHLAVVIGIVMIGYRHFDNIKTGIAAATLYLMMPYTALYTGRVEHNLPAALLIWAIALYRRPFAAGLLMGLVIGVIYYPAFLLPLWISFYWQRGLLRFLLGVVSSLAVLVAMLAFVSTDWNVFVELVLQMVGWRVPITENLRGFWGFDNLDPVYRMPVLAAFAALCGSFAIWPAQKNLGTLMSCSAAVMLGTQFWHAYGGGLYIAWYLPLLLLTIFRPNLEDRVALAVLDEGHLPKLRARKAA